MTHDQPAGGIRIFASWKTWADAEPTVSSTLGPDDASVLRRAYRFAESWHGDQRRPAGEPYPTHLLEALEVLLVGTGERRAVPLAAALLHDVVEDTPCSLSEVTEQFGPAVAELVEHLTKPEPATGQTAQQARQAYLDRLAVAPPDAIAVKLADRYSTTQRLHTHPRPAKQRTYYAETVESIIPLADGFPFFHDLFAVWRRHYAYLTAQPAM
ncbi:HD domain-containing protein [Frankia sp. CiP3]|uniref:HD domain-containing protein n=1 Tax=Frankia sp. CiP3 TaxID=2880971 RepID=UPI001EF45218|nr:HD domain-containing protein [Frankia sp. CiP3]